MDAILMLKTLLFLMCAFAVTAWADYQYGSRSVNQYMEIIEPGRELCRGHKGLVYFTMDRHYECRDGFEKRL